MEHGPASESDATRAMAISLTSSRAPFISLLQSADARLVFNEAQLRRVDDLKSEGVSTLPVKSVIGDVSLYIGR